MSDYMTTDQCDNAGSILPIVDASRYAHVGHEPHVAERFHEYPDSQATIMDSDMESSDEENDGSDNELDMARRAYVAASIYDLDWLDKSRDFAHQLWERFEDTNSDSLLLECIHVRRKICAAYTAGDSNRAGDLYCLALALETRFEQTGEQLLLGEAIGFYREELSLQPTGHPDRLESCSNLAASLWTQFELTGDESLLTEIIDLNKEALSLQPHGHPDRPTSCNNLAVSLKKRFDSTGEEALLAEAIELNREALALRPHGHSGRFESCMNLSNSLWTLFKQTGEAFLLRESINLNREALSLLPHEHPSRSDSCSNLSTSLLTYFNQTGEESALTEAIDLNREVLSLRSPGHPFRSDSCSNLAVSLRTRFEQTGEEFLLAEAIELEREGLSLLPNGHPDRSISCNNLAAPLMTRFELTGEEFLLSEAINLYREALSLRPHGHPLRFNVCSNLAASLVVHFKRTGETSLLSEAIDLYREALSLQPPGHADRSMLCDNLAVSLKTQFEWTGEESWLCEAIILYREALSLRPHGHSLRSDSSTHLAASLRLYFELTGDESVLVEAIDLNEKAIEDRPQHHPSRWRPITNLIDIYLDQRFSQHSVVHAINYMQQAVSLTSDDWPTLLSEIAHLTSRIDLTIVPHDSVYQLLQCLSAAIDIASRVAGFVLDPESQLQYLDDSQHLGPCAYWCAIACGQPQLGLELLERARAMMWTQALHMRNPQLNGAPPELASELELLLSGMNTSRVLKASGSLSLEASLGSRRLFSTEQDVRHKNGARIHQLIQQIRNIPGHETFMRGLSFEALAPCAGRSHVVVLIATHDECHVLIIPSRESTPVTMKLQGITPSNLAEMSVSKLRNRMRDSTECNTEDSSRFITSAPRRSTPVLTKLWNWVVKPIIARLQLQKASGSLRPRLHWCPTGDFMFLPLHAAGNYEAGDADCCADYVVSSYTPTLTALLRAQQSNASFRKHEALLNLVGVTKTQFVQSPILRYVRDELSHVRTAAENESVAINAQYVDDTAIVTHVAETFKGANLAHLACHGIQNPDNALSSGFYLSDGNLTISHLMNLNLKNAFFAFLSASETAKGDKNQPDQTVHLAAAMLFVGFRSVVATMWAMYDPDGPHVAKLFYEKLFAEDVITLDAIPYALDDAVAELRKNGVPPERWATFIHMGA